MSSPAVIRRGRIAFTVYTSLIAFCLLLATALLTVNYLREGINAERTITLTASAITSMVGVLSVRLVWKGTAEKSL